MPNSAHPPTRPSLLARVRDSGDEAAWGEFVGRYDNLILAYCRFRGLQPADADDVRQQVVLKLMRAFPNFDYDPKKGRFRQYLRRVVDSAIARWAQRRNDGPSLGTAAGEVAEPTAAEQRALEQQWEQEWVRHHFRTALAKLRATCEPKSVAVFERLMAGEEPEAVAADCETTVQIVYKTKYRLRKRLEELVQQQLRAEGLDDV